jgi:predicted ATPase
MEKEIVVAVENFGPFERADIKLKPLTIFIGRNSVGKSILMRLLWTLFTEHIPIAVLISMLTLPSSIFLIALKRPAYISTLEKARSNIINNIEKGLKPSEEDIRTIIRLYIEPFWENIEETIKNRIKSIYGLEPQELIKVGRDIARIRMSGLWRPMTIIIRKDGVRVEQLGVHVDELLNKLMIETLEQKALSLKYQGLKVEGTIQSLEDLHRLITDFIIKCFGLAEKDLKLIMSGHLNMIFLPDSRAGVIRLTFKPRPVASLPFASFLIEDVADKEFVETILRFSEKIKDISELPDSAKRFLEELGCKDFIFKSNGETRSIYVKTWTGKELPLHLAPSGIRESLALILALAVPETPSLIFIEESEAHLHPKANIELAKVIARAVNMGKKIIISTHSDLFLVALNNLIALSRIKNKAKELGFDENEVISPENVIAYLVKAEGDKAIVQELEIKDTGIPEDEFAKITEELIDKRAKIYYEFQEEKM